MDIDPYKFLNISSNPDGSITRLLNVPSVPPTGAQTSPPNLDQLCLSKDVPLNPAHNTFIRIFKPCQLDPKSVSKIPIIIYFHGGGFVFLSAASPMFHQCCESWASAFPAIVLSVDYRLAPENRLPAAYEDAAEAIQWVGDQAQYCADDDVGSGDPWMKELADFSKCFLMGSSSGGNIVYQAGLRVLDLDPTPIKIVGLIIIEPYFSGIGRTNSETQFINDKFIPLSVNHVMWTLSLPVGTNRDHEYCNPVIDIAHRKRVERLPRCWVKGYGGDPLVDKQKAFVKMLESCRVQVVSIFPEGGHHGVEMFDPEESQALIREVGNFISSDNTKRSTI